MTRHEKLMAAMNDFERNATVAELRHSARDILAFGLSVGMVALISSGKTVDEARDVVVKCVDTVLPGLKEKVKQVSQ